MPRSDDEQLEESRNYWNQEAATFDDEADHGLRNAEVYEAWCSLLLLYLPSSPAKILDIGCGTGSISVLLSRLGHEVTGIDLSPEMIAQSEKKAKAAGQPIDFAVMDASHPQLPEGQFDVIVCRHLLWALPERCLVLQRFANLPAHTGRLIMIEGYWTNAGGLHAEEIVAALPNTLKTSKIKNLSGQPELWGLTVTDERYILVADFVITNTP